MLEWLKKRRNEQRSKSESLRVRRVTFVCEQDGDVERGLKAHLVARFGSAPHLIKACLVQVRYEDSPELKVCLCLRTHGSVPDTDLVRVASLEFGEIFRDTESLDMLFITPIQEQQISVVAKPFYEQYLPPACD